MAKNRRRAQRTPPQQPWGHSLKELEKLISSHTSEQESITAEILAITTEAAQKPSQEHLGVRFQPSNVVANTYGVSQRNPADATPEQLAAIAGESHAEALQQPALIPEPRCAATTR